MPRAHPPINPEVLKWAIDESGYTEDELAHSLKVDVATLSAWVEGTDGPTQGQFTQLAGKLRRPKSIFFLPRPPEASGLPPTLRRAVGRTSRDLSAGELLWVRRARRLQRILSLLEEGQRGARVAVPRLSPERDPAGAGAEVRAWLGVTVGQQLEWSSAREALDAWRAAVEARGVVVMELQLGSDGLRGFALSDEYVPVVALNTHENIEARVFTLLHEVAHLASDTAKACLGIALDADRTERWCDEVASEAVLPREALREAVEGMVAATEPDFEVVRTLSSRFRVSLRATAMALIRDGWAERSLYAAVEEAAPASDYAKPGGGGGGGRRAPRGRLSEVGPRAAGAILAAMSRDRLGELEARRHLRLDGSELAELASELGRPA